MMAATRGLADAESDTVVCFLNAWSSGDLVAAPGS